MRAKKLLFLATAVAATFSSCSYDDYEISAYEEYTRNFIKTFGLIDPAQDWNLAEGTDVTVKVGDTPAHVKAYMKVDDTYYLVADLENVSGTVKIPFDMPEGTSDIMVKINGKRYYTAPGGTVDPAAPASRELLNNGTNTFAGVKVTVEENQKGRVLTLTSETFDEALDFLPESDDWMNSLSETNMNKKGIADNFVVTAWEFYLFPEYWKSDSYSSNIIGVYWYVEPNTEGAEHIKTYTPQWNSTTVENEYWIMKVPFFQNPRDFMTPYDKDDNPLEYEYGENSNSAIVTGVHHYKSKGIHVKFNKPITFGFYLEHSSGNIMYSESKLNPYIYFNDVEGNWERVSFAATFLNGEDTEHNDKRHLCFEDWPSVGGSGGNFDLNDMVFRVYGFDKIADGSMTKGQVVDIDKGETPGEIPTIPSTGDDDGEEDGDDDELTIKESEDAYNWLLAVEDLGATDDFDFNDIIMGISSVTVSVTGGDLPAGTRIIGNPTTGDNEAKIYKKVTFKALAAGGTRKAYVFYGGDKLYPDGKEGRAEWHAWFGNGQYSSSTMINTDMGTNNVEGATCTIYFGNFSLETLNGSVDAFNKQFKIGIDTEGNTSAEAISADYFKTEMKDGESYFVKPSDAGSAPEMFLIPDGTQWKWPKERTHIAASYPGFVDWVGGGSGDWYKAAGTNVCRPTKE